LTQTGLRLFHEFIYFQRFKSATSHPSASMVRRYHVAIPRQHSRYCRNLKAPGHNVRYFAGCGAREVRKEMANLALTKPEPVRRTMASAVARRFSRRNARTARKRVTGIESVPFTLDLDSEHHFENLRGTALYVEVHGRSWLLSPLRGVEEK
jgi:hypothetical protein